MFASPTINLINPAAQRFVYFVEQKMFFCDKVVDCFIEQKKLK
jgi:hypothetical protein